MRYEFVTTAAWWLFVSALTLIFASGAVFDVAEVIVLHGVIIHEIKEGMEGAWGGGAY